MKKIYIFQVRRRQLNQGCGRQQLNHGKYGERKLRLVVHGLSQHKD